MFDGSVRTIGSLILLTAVLASGCSGPGAVTDGDATAAEQTVAWSDVEWFDASKTADLPPPEAPDVEHDAPEALMKSEADDGIRVVVRGYRVQLFSSGQREEALEVEEAIRAWIDARSDEQLAALGISRDVSVYSLFRAPYYRVRVGDFETRSQAEPLSAALSRQFEGALIVPDMVEIRR
jgi:hypothetical protein